MNLHLITWHGTILIAGKTAVAFEQATLTHPTLTLATCNAVPLALDDCLDEAAVSALILDRETTTDMGFFRGCSITKQQGRLVTIERDGHFLCAESPPATIASWTRTTVGNWETFFLISSRELEIIKRLMSSHWIVDEQIVVSSREIDISLGYKMLVDGIELNLRDVVSAKCDTSSAGEVLVVRNSDRNQTTLRLRELDSSKERALSGSAREALHDLHLGNLQRSLKTYDSCSKNYGQTNDTIFYRQLIVRHLAAPSEILPAIMARTEIVWEADWLKELLPDLPWISPDCAAREITNRRLIVIDNVIRNQKTRFYREGYELGARMLLVHLSDEDFQDDTRVYRWCAKVLRNYYSPVIAGWQNLSFFPLGFNRGFKCVDEPPSIAERPYVWSFAGDPNKTTRMKMLDAMRSIEGGIEYLTKAFNSADNLTPEKYREMMRQSIFVPCPQGFANLDSFRVYEALESGCIPIVERREGFDYFGGLFGSYPFPSVLNWNEAPSMVRHMCHHKLVENLASNCRSWWSRYKISLRAQIHHWLYN